MILSKRSIKTTSIQKITKIHSGVWKLEANNLKNCQFWSKMAKFWPHMAKFWSSQNFPGIYTMIFSKKTTRVVSIPKLWKFIVAFKRPKTLYRPKTLKTAILAKNGQILTIFGVKKIFDHKTFWWSSKSYGDTTLCKKILQTVKVVGSERTNGRTNKRTYES